MPIREQLSHVHVLQLLGPAAGEVLVEVLPPPPKGCRSAASARSRSA